MNKKLQPNSPLWINTPPERSTYATNLARELESCQKLKPWQHVAPHDWIGIRFPDSKTPYLLAIHPGITSPGHHSAILPSPFPTIQLFSPRGSFLLQAARQNLLHSPQSAHFSFHDLADFIQVEFRPPGQLSDHDRAFNASLGLEFPIHCQLLPHFHSWKISCPCASPSRDDLAKLAVALGIATDISELARNLPDKKQPLWLHDDHSCLLRFPVFHWSPRDDQWEATQEIIDPLLEAPPFVAALPAPKLLELTSLPIDRALTLTIAEHIIASPDDSSNAFSRILALASAPDFNLLALDHSSHETDLARALSSLIASSLSSARPARLAVPALWIPILEPLANQLQIAISPLTPTQRISFDNFMQNLSAAVKLAFPALAHSRDHQS